ncbi:MAG: glycosyltransferase [Candidatus Omnitrophica bacterium]|nr:glycosyltransferase [Candidatus Omnitrophota bacterium]
MKTLCILLTDSLEVLYKKGEIKERYYNPDNLFSEVHMISFSDEDIEIEKVKITVGDARLYIHSVGRPNVFNLAFYPWRLSSLIRKITPDTIRAYDISIRGALACFIGKKLGIPVVTSLHINYDEQRKYDKRPILRLRKIFEYYSFARSDIVICVSEYVKSFALRHRKKDIELLYNRVEINRFVCNNRVVEKLSVPRLLCVSRMVKQKNQECIIEAIKDLNITLTLIGDGELYSYLNKLVERLGIKEKVTFIKSVPNHEIHNYYQKADIFVLSSHYEGFCIPIIEAMAAGLPIVASDLPVIVELLNGCGLLCKNSAVGFRKNVKLLLDNTDLRLSLGRKARERVKIFDSVELEKQEKRIYERLMLNARSK